MENSEARRQTDGRLPPSRKVIAEVARRTDVAPIDLPPLHDAVNPDALDALFRPTPTGSRVDGTVSFEYSGYDVTVHADGYVDIARLDH